MGLFDWLTARVDAAETASNHAIQMFRDGEISKAQALDVSQRYLEADRARSAYEADHGKSLGSAGSATYANVNGQVVDTSSAEYAAWWNEHYGQAPLD
jgi:hypothetical protein